MSSSLLGPNCSSRALECLNLADLLSIALHFSSIFPPGLQNHPNLVQTPQFPSKSSKFDPRSCNFFHQDPLNSTHPDPPKFTTFLFFTQILQIPPFPPERILQIRSKTLNLHQNPSTLTKILQVCPSSINLDQNPSNLTPNPSTRAKILQF